MSERKTKTSNQKEAEEIKYGIPSPREIKAYLDQFIVGQDEAKKVLSVAVHNHYRRILNNGSVYSKKKENGVIIDKSNILLMGETGSGKTYMIRKIAEYLHVPCYIQDCTNVTESGYVGNDVENCLTGLLRICNQDVAAAQCGIVVLDEVDKITTSNAGPSITKDVGGIGVQQSLLKIIEGDLVGVPPMGGRKHPEAPLTYVDTTNILFIATGAFVGIENNIKKRIGRSSIGYDVSNDTDDKGDVNLIDYVTAQDVKEYGMIPEFVGRFPVITHVNSLTEDDLVKILKEPVNSITSQYMELLKYENVELIFDDDALHEIAKYALNLRTGARGLRNMMESVMMDIMFDVPMDSNVVETQQRKITIDKDYVLKQLGKKYCKIAA